MNVIDSEIQKHYKNSKFLRKIYLANNKINFDKGQELQKQQDEEYNKMMFLKKLRKEMMKNGVSAKN